MKYRLSARAEAELDAIYYAGAASFGVAQADRYSAGLVDAFRFVARFPKTMRERPELGHGVRAHHFKTQVILHELLDEEVAILNIRHGREDWVGNPF